MIGSLIAAMSIQLTTQLVGIGSISGTLPAITAATTTTPIKITSTAHGVPPSRVVHAVISGVVGMTELNNTWELSYVDPNTLSVGSYTTQGVASPSVGVHTYVSGGTIQFAFPDWQILLGRQWILGAAANALPRIVFIPTDERAWGFDSYGGGSGTIPVVLPLQQGNAESQSRYLTPAKGSEYTTFEVHVSACANPPSPTFGDFDATQFLVHALVSLMIDDFGAPRAKVLRGSWPSQFDTRRADATGVLAQRGQRWMGIVEFVQPVYDQPLRFVPSGTSLVFTISTVQGGSSDDVTFQVS